VTSSFHKGSSRISRDQALTCCVREQVVAHVELPGGACHRVFLDDASAHGLEHFVLDAATVFWTKEQPEQAQPTYMLLQRVEGALTPLEREASTTRELQRRVRTLGVRLVDHATGDPLGGVDLVAASRDGQKKRASTDVRGRVSFQGLGKGPAGLRPYGSKASRMPKKSNKPREVLGYVAEDGKIGAWVVNAERTVKAGDTEMSAGIKV